MDYFSVVGIALGLSMDAFAVSVTNGALTEKIKIPYVLKLTGCFGLFQMVMPIAGWLVGKAGESFISAVDHWVAFILLTIIGVKMISDSIPEIKDKTIPEKQECLSEKTIVALAIATSIDALATGVILPSAVGANTLLLMFISVVLIGVITFIICIAGVYLGKIFGYFISKHTGIAGGTVLIIIGIKILAEHLTLK